MTTARLEAFSDGVLAIVLTIMVLELRAPHEPTLAALRPVLPVFGSYVLSFVFVGIYWNTTTTCSTRPSASRAACCGRTCTCCSGCR